MKLCLLPSRSLSTSVTSAAASPPAAADAPHAPEQAGVWRVLLFSFTVFLFSPELLSLLESHESSVAVGLCFNFCSQLAGFLLLGG